MTQDDPRVTQDDPRVTQDDPSLTQGDLRATSVLPKQNIASLTKTNITQSPKQKPNPNKKLRLSQLLFPREIFNFN